MLKKQGLLTIAGAVWLIAGLNVLKIGIECYRDYHSLINYALSILVFCFFHFMIFGKMVVKHTGRILGYEEDRQPFWRFLDLRSFLIMVIMIGGGISIRRFELLPQRFIAFFYVGLGTALTIAGIRFLVRRVRTAMTPDPK